jgi:hypothetical protein
MYIMGNCLIGYYMGNAEKTPQGPQLTMTPADTK